MHLPDFYAGNCFDAYRFFGAHLVEEGAVFRTYAPNAAGVAVIGSFNEWQGTSMHQEHQSGIYTVHIPQAGKDMLYKFRVYARNGQVQDHCDPYGFGMELRPQSASIIRDLQAYGFSDEEWMQNRSKQLDRPLNIYEVHLGSWRRNPQDPNGWYRYHEIADSLITYAQANHYNYLEFMPLSEHPADCSWGYQNTGFFSPTSRYGQARDLMELVDKCHQAGIGVIFDFVPVHFALDDYGLANYDGTALYEYPHVDVGVSEWGSHNFIHSRGDVRSFLQSAANYWLTEYHFDGIRMDALSRIIYWQGQPNRGVNTFAVNFVRTMNQGLQRLHPSVILMAEDSTAFPKVTKPVEQEGLGFDYKWDLGWMNDTLSFCQMPPEERSQHYHKLTFSMHYFYQERYLLPLCHDEVVHGKGSIVQKMYGSYEDKLKQARTFYLYMYTHPGKKLNFMGNEIAQIREWNEQEELDWPLLQDPVHRAFHRYIRALNALYQQEEALSWEEYQPKNFRWIDCHQEEKCLYIFARESTNQKLVAGFNFSNQDQNAFPISMAEPGKWRILIQSNWEPPEEGEIPAERVYETIQEEKESVLYLDLPAYSGVLLEEV